MPLSLLTPLQQSWLGEPPFCRYEMQGPRDLLTSAHVTASAGRPESSTTTIRATETARIKANFILGNEINGVVWDEVRKGVSYSG